MPAFSFSEKQNTKNGRDRVERLKNERLENILRGGATEFSDRMGITIFKNENTAPDCKKCTKPI
jgi:hypothetical protein